MLEELKKYNSIGTKTEFETLLFKILSSNEYKKIDDIRTICIHFSYTFGESFSAMIELLKLLSIIELKDANLIKSSNELDSYEEKSFFNEIFIFQKLFHLLNEKCLLNKLFNSKNIKKGNEVFKYCIKPNFIPSNLGIVKMFLQNTGFIVKDSQIASLYYLNPVFESFFERNVISHLKKGNSLKKLTKEDFDKLNNHLTVLGDEAEDFVFKFELNRLRKHSLKDEIKIISAEFINAGYDIDSFDSLDSIIIDRFIEVKSYSNQISFFWTQNEFEVARIKGDEYYLYLVDRGQINNENYTPIMIQNPYQNVLNGSDWIKTVDKYKVELNKEF